MKNTLSCLVVERCFTNKLSLTGTAAPMPKFAHTAHTQITSQILISTGNSEDQCHFSKSYLHPSQSDSLTEISHQCPVRLFGCCNLDYQKTPELMKLPLNQILLSLNSLKRSVLWYVNKVEMNN